ncbi:MATE family efflux transporter, partial [uncultured Cetobacterium sp.]|uniref:MATE family efflux transporter n=1 Tax=uncultured Cetobacterium sp. TaxID=527638 RepID=UPI00261D5604
NQGLQPIVSLNLGRKDYKKIRKVFKIAIITVIISSLLFYLVINIFTIDIIKAFINEKVAINLTKRSMKIYSLSYLLSGINILIAGYFTSINKAKQASIITALRGIILIIVLIYILPLVFGELGLWLTVPISETITLIISLIFLKRFKVGEENNEKNKRYERIREI